MPGVIWRCIWEMVCPTMRPMRLIASISSGDGIAMMCVHVFKKIKPADPRLKWHSLRRGANPPLVFWAWPETLGGVLPPTDASIGEGHIREGEIAALVGSTALPAAKRGLGHKARREQSLSRDAKEAL